MESMTPCSESRKEAISPMPFLSSKKIKKIGSWVVRSMYEANKAAKLSREQLSTTSRYYDYAKQGGHRVNIGEMVLYSGHEE